MSVESRSLGSSSRPSTHSAAARRERLFFGGMTIAMLATVIVGFGPTYYFSTVSGTTFQLTRVLHLHGAVFTTWMVLLALQTTLVAAGRTDVHRQLGVFGAVLGAFMVALAAYVPISRVQAGLMVPPAGIPIGVLLAIALASAVVFPVLLGAALLLRKRSDFHKRLVLIATLELVTAAVGRLPVIGTLGPPAFFAATDLFLAAIVIYDFTTRGRIHPATLWGGLFLIASQPLRLAIGFSAPWASWVGWLTS
jgi:hypothetical protein